MRHTAGLPEFIGGGDEDEIKIVGGEREISTDDIAINGDSSLANVLSQPVEEGYEDDAQLAHALDRVVTAYERGNKGGEAIDRGAEVLAERIRQHEDFDSNDELQEYVERLER